MWGGPSNAWDRNHSRPAFALAVEAPRFSAVNQTSLQLRLRPPPVEAPRFSAVDERRKIAGASAPGTAMKLAPQEIRTFFVTSGTWGRRPIFRANPLARLFLHTLAR